MERTAMRHVIENLWGMLPDAGDAEQNSCRLGNQRMKLWSLYILEKVHAVYRPVVLPIFVTTDKR